MIVGIIGSHSFTNYELFEQSLSIYGITELVSRGSVGADKLAEQYATEKNIKITITDITTSTSEFVRYCHHIIAFWDGKSRGTGKTIDVIRELKLPLTIIWS